MLAGVLPFFPGAAIATEEGKPAASGRVIFHGALLAKPDGAAQEERIRGVFAVDLETGRWKRLVDGGHFRVSRDGKFLAFQKEASDRRSIYQLSEIWIHDLTTDTSARALDDGRNLFPPLDGEKATKHRIIEGHPICWSPDSTQVIASTARTSKNPKEPQQCIARMVKRDGSGLTKLPIPEHDEINDWSPDGKWFVTVSDRHASTERGCQLYLMHTNGTEQLRLTKGGHNVCPRFSPDSRKIAYRASGGVRVMNVDGTDDHMVLRDEKLATFDDPCWSPDGHHLAVIRYDHEIENGESIIKLDDTPRHGIEIMDADGTNRQQVRFSGAKIRWISLLDWL
jgi:Tol biopolymer transport system component